MSVYESMGSCDSTVDVDSIVTNEVGCVKYVKWLVYLHLEHQYLYELSLVNSEDFLLDNINKLYENNMYCMLWFYEGVYPFEKWEEEYDRWLAEQVYGAMMDYYCSDFT